MDILIKINNQTNGRDKIARFFQYLSRFLWHRLRSNTHTVNNFKNIEFQLSTFRKLLRFGRFAESLYATLPVYHHDDPTIRYTVILSKIANSLFLLADHILWLGRADICNVNTTKWSQISYKYWLYSITMNLVRDFYEIIRLIKFSKVSSTISEPRHVLTCFIQCIKIVTSDEALVIDTVKNCCDFFIPFVALGYAKISPGTVGLLGCISSLAGLLVIMQPYRKLSPS